MIHGKVIIGNEEWCALPAFGVPAIKARVDSGAKTSAVHALNINSFIRDAREWVSFDIDPLSNRPGLLIHCEAPVVDRRSVKNSFGHTETRYVIHTVISLGDFRWEAEVSLTNRDSMEYRMLLGRNAMRDHVLVDPAKGCYFGDKGRAELDQLYTSLQTEPGQTVNKPQSHKPATPTKGSPHA